MPRRFFLRHVPLAAAAASIAHLSATPVPVNPDAFHGKIAPLVERFCLDCHSTAEHKGDLDLERFTSLDTLRADTATWQHALDLLRDGEMPPEDEPQPTPAERATLGNWLQAFLDAEALAAAGDPGPVILRRLNNAEYTYTLRDLTGVPSLQPATGFPADSAAGEGFTNTGATLSMSPALVEKVLDASKRVATHAVLLPDGIRFSPHTTRRDHTDEIVERIRGIYLDAMGAPRVEFTYAGEVTGTVPEVPGEGRLDPEPHIRALLDPAATEAPNPTYHKILTKSLRDQTPGTPLLRQLHDLLTHAQPPPPEHLAAMVRGWQNALWEFQPVGTYGLVRPWQKPADLVAPTRPFRIGLPPGKPGAPKRLSLVSRAFIAGSPDATSVWRSPRIESPGRPPVPLAALDAVATKLDAANAEFLARPAAYLNAVHPAKASSDAVDATGLARANQLDPDVFVALLDVLGIARSRPARIAEDQRLRHQVNDVNGYAAVDGWTIDGVADLSIIANASDQTFEVPGRLAPHSVAVHPRPERWIAAAWQSPVDADVQITPVVADAHNACGNGVSWALLLQQGNRSRTIASGEIDNGKAAALTPYPTVPVHRGDLISLVIDARDGSHVCDLTLIDLQVETSDQTWSLSAECSPDILAGNPHPDRLGNPGVWHFYSGTADIPATTSRIPGGSILARWLETADPGAAASLADGFAELLSRKPDASTSSPDRLLHRLLTTSSSPLLAAVPLNDLPPASDIVTPSHSVVEATIHPALLAKGTAFVAEACLSDGFGDVAVQFEVPVDAGHTALHLKDPLIGAPVIAHPGSPGETAARTAFDDFRQFFPAALCYTRVVPVDEVVTLQLFHREDDHLVRLMLDDETKAQLDRLWSELRFVSRGPERLVTGYEQLWQFATQDSDPKKIEPLEAQIRAGAERFAADLEAAEPSHLDAVLAFAARAFRCPLTEPENSALTELYKQLREADVSHDEAVRLTLARVLASPRFLYRSESPPAPSSDGAPHAPVSAHELATRLSYFLTASTPDAELLAAAASGALLDPTTLGRQARRLLGDPTNARRFATEFFAQWLHVRDFHELDEKNTKAFPEFPSLQADMREETLRFFTDLIRNNRPVLSLLDADHTFINTALAGHYGLTEQFGDTPGWRRFDGLHQRRRSGVLTHASLLAKHAGASRSSPVLRGTFIAESLLGDRLPDPPPDVPPLPDTVPEGLTSRQLAERHVSDPACANCHQRIDPFGFAFEQFDAIGRYRQDAHTATALRDGTPIADHLALRDYLLDQRRHDILSVFARKLLGYALARPVQLSDQPLLDEIVDLLGADKARFHTAVFAIIHSTQFRHARTAP